jgi:hypothetical protein
VPIESAFEASEQMRERYTPISRSFCKNFDRAPIEFERRLSRFTDHI